MLRQSLSNLKITTLNRMQNAALAAAKKGDVILLFANGFREDPGVFAAASG